MGAAKPHVLMFLFFLRHAGNPRGQSASDRLYLVGQNDAEVAQAARERRLERTPGWSASCAFPKGRTQQADRQLQTHTDRKVTVRVANAYQSAPAAYRLTLVGAAVMSAGGRQALFDSIPSLDRSPCIDRPAVSNEVGRHGHGRQGDLLKPCSMRSGANPR